MRSNNIIKKIQSAKKPVIIFISGIPASGKSTLAVKLAAKLNFKVCIGVDEIKEVVKHYDKNPFIKRSSHNCWQLLGARSDKNILKGYEKYCFGMTAGVSAIINQSRKTGENLIIEGVQLLPKLYSKFNNFNCFHFVLVSNFDRLHQNRIKQKITERHQIQTDVWSKKEKELKLIQLELIRQAKKCKNCYLLAEKGINEKIKRIITTLEKNEIF
jgi:2-phosphoglycerate kinase